MTAKIENNISITAEHYNVQNVNICGHRRQNVNQFPVIKDTIRSFEMITAQ